MAYKNFVSEIIGFINILIPAMFAGIFLIIIWKIIDAWILHADDQNKRDEGKRLAVTAVLVFVVAVSVWGIVALIRTSFLPIQ